MKRAPVARTWESRNLGTILQPIPVSNTAVFPLFLSQGDQKKFSAAARQRAVKYLERNLPKMKDSYELAIVAYALAVSGSAKSDLAYRALKGAMKEEGGMIYWSRSKIETNKVQ